MVSYDKTPVARRGSETASPYRCANGENLFRKDVDAKAEQVSRLQHQQGESVGLEVPDRRFHDKFSLRLVMLLPSRTPKQSTTFTRDAGLLSYLD
ncbi:uncharacterized protein L203_103333 [Cryptococcus depauperatus CBS 7841]|uniref:Uncharacterized protein n=1 Tax=Cryptococcus depauperatus CBS 7841 TaxID=1295531 RepID=A0AAJ8JTE6_9TREE